MKRGGASFWQSYADLAMGLMAVMILMLLLKMFQQQDESKQNVELTRALLRALRQADGIMTKQRDVEKWIHTVFELPGCQLAFDASSGGLRPEGGAELYATGQTRLGPRGRDAIESCADNFLLLAVCLDPDLEDDATCAKLMTALDSAEGGPEVPTDVMREAIDGLVLQGSTDRVRFAGAPTIGGLPPGADAESSDSDERRSFVTNAFLGSERARQALGHLLYRVEVSGELHAAEARALQRLLARVRIESRSFGEYQVGPGSEWDDRCDPATQECEAARNLSLRVAWRRESLQKPFRDVREEFCDQIGKLDLTMERDPEALSEIEQLCSKRSVE